MLVVLTESLQPLDPPIDMAIAVGVPEDIAIAALVAIFITVEAVEVATPTALPRPISISIVSVVLLCIDQKMASSGGVGEVK